MSNHNRSAKSVSRRSILKGMGATAAAVALAPQIFVRADDQKVIGDGDYKYEVINNWGALPDGKKYGNTHGVQIDSQGRVIIHNQSDDSICIFDTTGKFVQSWGREYHGGAHGLQLIKEGNEEFLILSLTGMSKVVKTNLKGEVVWTISCPKHEAYSEGKGFVPTNAAIARNGDIYVGDGYGKHFIHHYNSKGEYLKSWGGAGSEAGKMSCPHGIFIDSRDGTEKIVVADRSNSRLQYFTLDGQHIGFVKGEVRAPCHFDVYKDLLLIPDLECRLTILGKDNKAVAQLGDYQSEAKAAGGWPNIPMDKRFAGKFIAPHGACFDKDGNIFVVEWVPQGRVTKLRKVS